MTHTDALQWALCLQITLARIDRREQIRIELKSVDWGRQNFYVKTKALHCSVMKGEEGVKYGTM